MTSPAESDAPLLDAWLNRHDEQAFRDLVNRYAGLVHQAALRSSGDASLAAEAGQATFITLAHKARTLAGRESIAGWLHTTAVMITRNLMRSHMREERKRRSLLADSQIQSTTEAWEAMKPALDEALAELSETDREALLLRYYRALNVRDIAHALGISLDAAQKRLTRATERLRDNLATHGCAVPVATCALGLAMFAQDAKAGIVVAPSFASKALAAPAAASAWTLLTTTLMTTKQAALLTTAAVLLLGAGVFVALKDQPERSADTGKTASQSSPQIAASSRTTATDPAKRRSTGSPIKEGWPDLSQRYGDERSQLARVVTQNVISLVDESVAFGDSMLAAIREERAGGNLWEGLANHLALSEQQRQELKKASEAYYQDQFERMKSVTTELCKNPKPVAAILLASDARSRGEMTDEEYKAIDNPLNTIMRDTMSSNLITGSDPLHDEAYRRVVAPILDPQQTAKFEDMIKQTELSPEETAEAAEKNAFMHEPKGLEEIDGKLKWFREFLKQSRPMLDQQGNTPAQ